MKRFRFTLQTPLNVKTTIEKQLMGELSACNARLREFEARQEENYRRLALHGAEYRRILEEGVSAGELPLWRAAFMADREQIEHTGKAIEQTQGEVARVQKKLTETVRERKTLESLREKQYEDYKAAVRAEDAAQMDDFMSSRSRSDEARTKHEPRMEG